MKYNIGDKVRIKDTDIEGTIESIIRGQFIVDTKVSKIPAWPEDIVLMKYVEEETKPNIIEEAKTYWDSIKDAWICPEGYIFKDENGNVINAQKIILEKQDENSKPKDMGEVSDGYHTFNELYEYRMLYNAALFNEFAKQGLYDVHKSKKHSDGQYPFNNSNWFIVIAELPTGQISNHYEMKDWNKFNIPEKELANEYDGHSPKDVTYRLIEFLNVKN